MTAYTFSTAVRGEVATGEGLVPFAFKPGATIEDTDPLFAHVYPAGVLQEPKQSAKAAAPAADTTEEN